MTEEHTYFKFSNTVVFVPMCTVLLMWFVYWVEVQFSINLNDFGVYPRKLSGLQGVIFSPFLHGSVEHLYNNTIPIVILMASLFYFYKGTAWRVLLYGILMVGFLTWVIGRPSYHIGISGIIYLLASFIFFKGVFTKYYRLVALSLFVAFIYGSMLWYIFPIEDGISWEGHLSGFLSGLLLAVLIKTQIPKPKKYKWEEEDYNEDEDEFLQHFDKNGNFIEKQPEAAINENDIKITYHYKKEE